MRMMFEEDAFDHVEFILCIQFIGASKGSEARLYQWSFVNNQHCSSDGCNWVGLGETITNYKVSSCPFACHRLRPTLPANFFIIFFVEVFVFNIWVPDLFGSRRI